MVLGTWSSNDEKARRVDQKKRERERLASCLWQAVAHWTLVYCLDSWSSRVALESV